MLAALAEDEDCEFTLLGLDICQAAGLWLMDAFSLDTGVPREVEIDVKAAYERCPSPCWLVYFAMKLGDFGQREAEELGAAAHRVRHRLDLDYTDDTLDPADADAVRAALPWPMWVAAIEEVKRYTPRDA